jgi:hypothetical protein
MDALPEVRVYRATGVKVKIVATGRRGIQVVARSKQARREAVGKYFFIIWNRADVGRVLLYILIINISTLISERM